MTSFNRICAFVVVAGVLALQGCVVSGGGSAGPGAGWWHAGGGQDEGRTDLVDLRIPGGGAVGERP